MVTRASPAAASSASTAAPCVGPSGLEAHRAIVEGLPRVLAPGGRVLLEIAPTQGPAVQALLAAAGCARVTIHRDLDGRDRAVEAS